MAGPLFFPFPPPFYRIDLRSTSKCWFEKGACRLDASPCVTEWNCASCPVPVPVPVPVPACACAQSDVTSRAGSSAGA